MTTSPATSSLGTYQISAAEEVLDDRLVAHNGSNSGFLSLIPKKGNIGGGTMYT